MISRPHRHRTPPGPDADIAELLHYAAISMRRAFARAIEEWGLSPHQAKALACAVSFGPTRVSDLAEALHIARRSATEVFDHLQQRGLIERHPSPTDRRSVLIEATEEGKQLSCELTRAREASRRDFLDHLPAEDQAELAALLRKLIERQVERGHEIEN